MDGGNLTVQSYLYTNIILAETLERCPRQRYCRSLSPQEESAPEGELEPVWQEEARREYEAYLATENKLLIELGVVEPLPQDED